MYKKNITQKTNFFYKYWTTFVLIIALSTLFWQSFIINQFPQSLNKKQQIVDKNIRINEKLAQQNQQLILKLKADIKQEILESKARYRFGMVKADEIFYRINQ